MLVVRSICDSRATYRNKLTLLVLRSICVILMSMDKNKVTILVGRSICEGNVYNKTTQNNGSTQLQLDCSKHHVINTVIDCM